MFGFAHDGYIYIYIYIYLYYYIECIDIVLVLDIDYANIFTLVIHRVILFRHLDSHTVFLYDNDGTCWYRFVPVCRTPMAHNSHLRTSEDLSSRMLLTYLPQDSICGWHMGCSAGPCAPVSGGTVALIVHIDEKIV